MNRIVVIGGDHHNTLGVVRSLGEKGLTPEVLITSKDGDSFVVKSKYVNKAHIIRGYTEIIPFLKEHYSRLSQKAVVICCHDASASEIDLHSSELKEYCYVPGASEQGRITLLMNKQRMSKLAEECGLVIPETVYPNHTKILENEISFPCIIKPLVSKDASKEDIRICYRISDVNESLESLDDGNVQIQQYIDKAFEYQLIGCSTDKDVIIPGVSVILRPCKGSNTSFLHYKPLEPDFCDIDKCVNFVRRTGYKGLFSMEFLRDKQGQDFFMEINFRNDGNAICVTAAGLNLPYIWYLSCIGKDYCVESNKQIAPKYVMPDSAEIRLLATKQITFFQYISDLLKTDKFMEFDWKDQKPFWKMIQMKFKHLWSKST